MRPLATRIAQYATAHPVETSMVQVYERVLWVFEQERAVLESAILHPKRVSSTRFRRLHTALARLAEDTALVQAMLDRHLGNPVAATRKPPRSNAPTSAYGEL